MVFILSDEFLKIGILPAFTGWGLVAVTVDLSESSNLHSSLSGQPYISSCLKDADPTVPHTFDILHVV